MQTRLMNLGAEICYANVCLPCVRLVTLVRWDCWLRTPQRAQYRPAPTEAAIGENYHIEASYGWWDAEPALIVNSESLGILGTDVDLINDLGIEKHRLGKFDLVLKPAKKHRFKFQHLPIKYETDAFPVQRAFVFNGQRYTVGLPVTTIVDFTTYSFGYEYDFLYFPRGFVGANINMKLHQHRRRPAAARSARSSSSRRRRFRRSASPAAATSRRTSRSMASSRSSASRRTSRNSSTATAATTTSTFTRTYNFNKYVGAQLGWRKTTIFYEAEFDTGDLKFTGMYFGGVVRY